MRQIKKAMAFGKHVISEKPVADTIEHEWGGREMRGKLKFVLDR